MSDLPSFVLKHTSDASWQHIDVHVLHIIITKKLENYHD